MRPRSMAPTVATLPIVTPPIAAPKIVTLGCRLNIAESKAIAAHATAAGHGDVIIVNTCAVTAEATRQAAKTIRRLRREHPSARIVVTGCAAQVEPMRFAAMAEVDHVLGNAEKMAPEAWAGLKRSNRFGGAHNAEAGPGSLAGLGLKAVPGPLAGPGSLAGPGLAAEDKLEVGDIMQAGPLRLHETAAHLADEPGGHTRAFVQVQNGCDHRCTFCIIPYGRGPSRSVPMGAVVAHLRALVESGVKEVVLTGVDTTSYGQDLPGSPALGTLVQAILRHVPELPRLRLSSIDAVEIDDALREALATERRLMPHLHLSLQHGDDLILKRMKRRHGGQDAIRLCEELRALRPGIVFGADMIAGFPTEDEAMFARALEVAEACGIAWLHAFPFSARPGTAAARMPQLAAELVRERAARMRGWGDMARQRHLGSLAGTVQSVLTERGNTGHTEGFAPVRFQRDVPAGEILTCPVAGTDGARLLVA
jgi:threonylcarbamoyladenosine tRNA methylthiotransferase MtaB